MIKTIKCIKTGLSNKECNGRNGIFSQLGDAIMMMLYQFVLG